MRSATLIMGTIALIVKASSAAGDFAQAQEECRAGCHKSDTRCQADCVQLHNPGDDNIMDITACQMNCRQGDGSAQQTSEYGMCLTDCIESGGVITILPTNDLEQSTTAATSFPTGSVTKTGTQAKTSSSHSHTQTSTSPSVPSANAAAAVQAGFNGMSLLGLVAAFFV